MLLKALVETINSFENVTCIHMNTINVLKWGGETLVCCVCRLWCVGILRFMMERKSSDVMTTAVDRQRPLEGEISFLKTKLGSR